jgi:hypothetical protein
MKKLYSISILLTIYLFLSCGKDEKKPLKKSVSARANSEQSMIEKNTDTLTEDSTAKIAKDAINDVFITEKTKPVRTILNKKSKVAVKKSIPKKQSLTNEITAVENKTTQDEKLESFVYFRKMLADCKVGQTLTQKQLMINYNIPKEGVKLIKSITKIAEDEIAVKWHKNWFVEKISDAKFSDASMKVSFKANKMYTSGKAIGIKYNQKIYTDLIIIGRMAYIPSVKGYHWQIGK